MLTLDLFEDSALARGVDNTKALLRAVAHGQDATLLLGTEPVTVAYPEARFMVGKFRAFQKAGRATEFYADMADPVSFDAHMKQLRALIDKQKNFRSTVKDEMPVQEKQEQDITSDNARINRMLKQLRSRNPQAKNDLEALIYDYRASQARDRADISRLDSENDTEDELIDRLQRDLDRLKGMRQSDMSESKKDACYHKVKSRYKVWPSAYASGALVQCRKQGADNWGTGGKDK